MGAELSTLLSTQNADNVNISGGTVAGVTLTATNAALTTPTITNPTVTTGTFTSPTLNTPTINGAITASTVRTSSALTKNASAAYADIPGLSFTVVPGTYKFTLMLPSTVASGTGGIKYCFAFASAVFSAMEATAQGYTASAVAVQHTTTATTGADLFSQAAVVIFVQIEGSFVCTTGGVMTVQMAQNTSDGSDTVALIGGTAQFTRIA